MPVRSILAELGDALSPGALTTDRARLSAHRADEAADAPAGVPLCLVAPSGTDDVVATMRWATAHRVPVVPRGAGTGLAGGANAVDGCVLLALDRMSRIEEIAVDDQLAKVQAGVVTAELDRAAAGHGLRYRVEPGSASRSTLGGNLATNAGGLRCAEAGVTRDSVLGMEVVLADGRLLRTGTRTTKGVTGYDLTSLFVGSEGTLGVIVGATLRLHPVSPHPPVTVAAWCRDGVAAATVAAALAPLTPGPGLLELVDDVTLRALAAQAGPRIPTGAGALLLGQFTGASANSGAAAMAEVCHGLGAVEVDVTADPARGAALLDLRREALLAVGRRRRTLVEDFVVPRSRLAQMMAEIRGIADECDVLVGTVAHAGEGNVHPTFVYDSAAREVPGAVLHAAHRMFRTALRLGGTLTGEHGVGVLKRQWLGDELGDVGLDVHRTIKAALDPLDILNPGKVL